MKDHDPHHPYVRKLIGCGHGVLFSDYCKDCEIVAVQEQYKNAIRTVQRCRNELRLWGAGACHSEYQKFARAIERAHGIGEQS